MRWQLDLASSSKASERLILRVDLGSRRCVRPSFAPSRVSLPPLLFLYQIVRGAPACYLAGPLRTRLGRLASSASKWQAAGHVGVQRLVGSGEQEQKLASSSSSGRPPAAGKRLMRWWHLSRWVAWFLSTHPRPPTGQAARTTATRRSPARPAGRASRPAGGWPGAHPGPAGATGAWLRPGHTWLNTMRTARAWPRRFRVPAAARGARASHAGHAQPALEAHAPRMPHVARGTRPMCHARTRTYPTPSTPI